MSSFFLFCLFPLFAFGESSIGTGAKVVSTAVGQVKNFVVTSRDVQIQNLLEISLFDKSPQEKIKILGLDSKPFSKAVQATLLEWVVSLEAQSFSLVEITDKEINEHEKTALKALQKAKVWTQLEVSSSELNSALKRKILSKKLIEFRAKSSVLPVTDVEAQRYFEENRLKFGNLPFENFKENIKSFLSRNQVDKRIKDWIEVLMAKYKVKNLIAET